MTTPHATPSTKSVPAPDRIVRESIAHAQSFYRRHAGEPGVSNTYGYFTSHPFAPLNRKRLRAILGVLHARRAELNRPLRVLDLACGGGLITCSISALGCLTLGMDLSPDEIRLARLFAQEERMDGMFMQTDLINDPNWERSVQETLGGRPDAVTMAYALHHLPQVEEFVARLGRWLEPGALLVINEENPESPLFRLKHRLRSWIQHDTDVEWHRTHSGWKTLLEANGFKVRDALVGLDLLPALDRLKPERCWSLVFAAQRS